MNERQTRLQRRADDAVRVVETQGAPPHLRAMVRLFADHAPEVLALGPVPASFVARILAGLASDDASLRVEFQALIARESAPPASPAITSMRASGLIVSIENGPSTLTEQGRMLLDRLARAGAMQSDHRS